MVDPLAGFDMGPNDIFYDGPTNPVVAPQRDEQFTPQQNALSHPVFGGDLHSRVVRLEEQVQRLLDMAGIG